MSKRLRRQATSSENAAVTKAINKFCPRSGKPVEKDALTEYRGHTVGFCNPGCRDHFAANIPECKSDTNYFDVVIKESGL